MVHKILVPLDGSAFGEQALPVALSIARRAGATLHLAHVHVAGQSADVDGPAIAHTSLDIQARATERAYLDRLAQPAVSSYDLHVERVLLDGPVVGALCDYAQASDADLIVMSTHGRGVLGRVWPGSVTAALARLSPVPLLLVPPQKPLVHAACEPVFRHILIPLDGSPLSELALKPAVTLGALTGARYTLLRALDPLVVQHTHPPYAAGADPQLSAEVQASAATYLERVAARLLAQTLNVQTSLVVGLPALSIREYVQAHDVDLIAMATHGYGGVSGLLLGSVTDAVVQTADVPILLARPIAV